VSKKSIIGAFLGIVSFTFLLFGLLSHLRVVENESMVPSLYPDDIVFIGKGEIKRNSIVIIKKSDTFEIIKRVVGLPGDSISHLVDSLVLKNKRAFFEDGNISNDSFRRSIIPDGFYYVLGDNINRSFDSRQFGLVSNKSIQGIVYFTICKSKINSQKE
jgi:signal peptidase I